MKSILEKVSFTSDENMSKETTEMLPALADVKYFHLKCGLGNHWVVLNHGKGTS